MIIFAKTLINMNTEKDPMKSEIVKKAMEEINRESYFEVKKQERRNRREAYSLVFLLLSLAFFVYILIAKEHIPIWLIVVIAIGDILSLRGLGII